MNFEAAQDMMDDVADAKLGDDIEVSLDNGDWVPRKGFVFDEAGVLGMPPIDALDYRIRLKIRKAYAPFPSRTRFRGTKLGAGRVWRITGDVPDNVGKYFVFDITPGVA